MYFKTLFILATLIVCESGGVYIYSSFWAPLFNPRILNYRVDVKFEPDAGKNDRVEFEKKYGFRGVKLINDLGNGKGPSVDYRPKKYEDVHFYYTYPGADEKDTYDNEVY